LDDEPDAPMQCIHRRKYCRRLWQVGNNEFQRYLQIASGSASEVDYHFLLARDLGFFEELDYRRLAGELLQLRKCLHRCFRKYKVNV
jgi:four helix bundle protein